MNFSLPKIAKYLPVVFLKLHSYIERNFEKGLFIHLGYCTTCTTITFVNTRVFLYFLPQFMYYVCKRNLNAKYVLKSTFIQELHFHNLEKNKDGKYQMVSRASFSEYQKRSLSTSFTYIYLNSTTAAGRFVTFG